VAADARDRDAPAGARSEEPDSRLELLAADGKGPVDSRLLGSVQRAAGNQATAQLVKDRLHNGVSTVQRRVVPGEQGWLRGLLAARAGDLSTRIGADPAARLLGLDMGDRVDTVASVRADVDAFEVAVGSAPGFTDPNAARIVSAL